MDTCHQTSKGQHSEPPSVGSGPTEIRRSADWPGARAWPGIAIQVIAPVASVVGMPVCRVGSAVLSSRTVIFGAQSSFDSG